jgi:hypothetical protein
MFNVKHKIVQALLGAVAVAALSLAVPAGTGPVTHADNGAYPPNIYGPGGTGFGLSGPWYDSGGYGLRGNEVYTFSNGPDGATSFASWAASNLQPNIPYDVCAWIPNWDADAKAEYFVADRFGNNGPFVVDQSRFSNQWALVGFAYTDSLGQINVALEDQSADPAGSTVIGADAMAFIPGYQASTTPLHDGQYPTQYECNGVGLG